MLHTVITTEEPCDFKDNNNERYYPVKDVSGSNLEIYKLYDKYVKQNFQNLTFTGRLGKYVYINMDQCVNIGINDAKLFLKHHID